MSSRRSARAKAPVKYTSDSEGSDFGAKRPRKTPTKPKSTPKKRAKEDHEDDATPARKRTKNSPSTLAAEFAEKSAAQEAKAQKQEHKKVWEKWLAAHKGDGGLLDKEPGKEESITQTDSAKKYGLKPEELKGLRHFEKRHPVYNNTVKTFVEEEVKLLGFRKIGMLAGVEENEVVKRGEEIWKEEHKNDAEPTATTTPKATPSKPKTAKQNWTTYISTHAITSPDALKDEPEEAINQSDSKTKYTLTPADLAVLPYFPKPNPKYGNIRRNYSRRARSRR